MADRQIAHVFGTDFAGNLRMYPADRATAWPLESDNIPDNEVIVAIRNRGTAAATLKVFPFDDPTREVDLYVGSGSRRRLICVGVAAHPGDPGASPPVDPGPGQIFELYTVRLRGWKRA